MPAYAGGVFVYTVLPLPWYDAGPHSAVGVGLDAYVCSHLSSSLFLLALSVTSLGHGYNTLSVGKRHRPVEGAHVSWACLIMASLAALLFWLGA